ncbi:MAG TPA: hypothetical protein VHF22_04490, partial [Planctomycetota bacterium]|nr:hypothetical protein [Planctomycetota bacterium]
MRENLTTLLRHLLDGAVIVAPMNARDLAWLAVLAAIVQGSPAALAQEKPAPPSTPAPARSSEPGMLDWACPDCHRPLTWDMNKCPSCGAEFEPVRLRTKKGAAPRGPDGTPTEAETASGTGAGTGALSRAPTASPIPAPPQGAPPDKEPPPHGIVEQPWDTIRPPERERFGFGSYGRVGFDVGTDLHGAKPIDIVDNRPILGKKPYQELHFFYKDKLGDQSAGGLPVLIHTTLAFDEKLFAYDGDFDARIALRELYAQVDPLDWLSVWVGERMYRGDNIYLLDFWPLDDLNTLGGGAIIKFADVHRVQVHFGVNR